MDPQEVLSLAAELGIGLAGFSSISAALKGLILETPDEEHALTDRVGDGEIGEAVAFLFETVQTKTILVPIA